MTMNNENEMNQANVLCGDVRKATGRLIATFGAAQILRHRDGSLDVTSNNPTERNAALAWMYTISPELAGRVRRCPESAA